MKIESVKIEDLSFDPANARKHSKKNLDAIKGSLRKFGQQKPIVVDGNNVVVAGNGTLEAARALGWTEINIVRTKLTGPDAIAFALADNRTAELAEWDLEPLNKTLQSLKDIDFDLGSIGFDAEFLGEHLGGDSDTDGSGEPGNAKLSDTFLVPPFTVLDARQGYWQERKRQWLSLGIKSELGRGEA